MKYAFLQQIMRTIITCLNKYVQHETEMELKKIMKFNMVLNSTHFACDISIYRAERHTENEF